MGYREYLQESSDKQTLLIVTLMSDKMELENKDRVSNEEHQLADVSKSFGFTPHILFFNKMYFEDKGNTVLIKNNRFEEPVEIILDPTKTKVILRQGVHDKVSEAFVKLMKQKKIPVINDPEAIRNCSDKYTTATLLENNNVSTPRFSLVPDENSIDYALKKIGGKFPIVVKTINRGLTGKGVIKVDNKETLLSVLQALWLENPAEIIFQEYFEIDGDIRTFIINGEIISAMKRKKMKGDFRSNASLGADVIPYTLNEDEKKITLAANKAMGTDYCGVDHFLYKGKPYIIEVNGCPGFKALERAYNKKGMISKKLIEYLKNL